MHRANVYSTTGHKKTQAVWLLVTLVLLLPALAGSSPSNRKVWTFTQPDRTTFQAILVGDEFYAYHKTPQGEIILQKPSTGYWHYAIPRSDGTLDMSSQVVGTGTANRTLMNRDLAPWLRAVEKIVDERVAELEESRAKNQLKLPTGTMKGVVLLANFSDTTATFALSDFSNLLNTQNYSSNGASGSVKDFYLEASYGTFTLTTDVYGWYNLANSRAYYGANVGGVPGQDIRPADMVTEALILSNSAVDYSNYDSDADGYVDLFGVVHQGQGEEQSGASADCIWSHCAPFGPATVDGKSINIYHTEPEMYYGGLCTIGVICHETGHAFRLPDLYDIDSSSAGVGTWSVMSTGMWNGPSGDGSKPCHHDPWCKTAVGWVTPTVVKTSQTGVSLPAFDQSPTVLLVPVDPYQDGEYLLVCNRYARNTGVAGTGFDRYLPGSGALVLHVDDYITRNNDESHKKVDVEEADGLAELDSATDYGDSGDLYPNGGTSLTDATNPNAKDYEGNSTGISLNTFTGAGTAVMSCNITPRSLSGEYIAYDSMGATGEGIGWSDDGNDFGLVVFSTTTTSTLRRVKTFFKYNGTTTYTVNVYSGFDTGSRLPTGLLTTESGTVMTSGSKEIVLSSPQTIPAGSTFCIEIHYQTGGGDPLPVPIANDGGWSGKSYARSQSGFSYYQLTPATGWPQDVNIRADIPVRLSQFTIE